jgi:hypothetical protein
LVDARIDESVEDEVDEDFFDARHLFAEHLRQVRELHAPVRSHQTHQSAVLEVAHHIVQVLG